MPRFRNCRRQGIARPRTPEQVWGNAKPCDRPVILSENGDGELRQVVESHLNHVGIPISAERDIPGRNGTPGLVGPDVRRVQSRPLALPADVEQRGAGAIAFDALDDGLETPDGARVVQHHVHISPGKPPTRRVRDFHLEREGALIRIRLRGRSARRALRGRRGCRPGASFLARIADARRILPASCGIPHHARPGGEDPRHQSRGGHQHQPDVRHGFDRSLH